MLGYLERTGQTWLKRHGLGDLDLTPLFLYRLQVRKHANKYLGPVTTGVVLGVVTVLQTGSGTARLVGTVALIVSVLAVRYMARRRRHAGERDVASILPRRVTHTVPLRGRDVVGTGYLWASVLAYLGPALVVLTAGDSGPTSPAALAAFGVIVAVLVLDGIEVATIVHRPTLAEDEPSLAIDDALRAEDARLVLASPLPALLSWTFLSLRFEPSWHTLTVLAFSVLLFGLEWAAKRVRPSPQLVASLS